VTLIVAALGGLIAKRKSWRLGLALKLSLIAAAAVVLTGVGIISLIVANAIWASSLFTLALSLLVVAAIGAVTSGPPRNSFLVGYAVFGWCYFLVHFGPLASTGMLPKLLSTELVTAAQEWLHPAPPAVAAPTIAFTGPTYGPYPGSYYGQAPAFTASFQMIGHSQLMILAGAFGGILGWLFSLRRNPPGSTNRPADSSDQ
jgi:hypothetical protein